MLMKKRFVCLLINVLLLASICPSVIADDIPKKSARANHDLMTYSVDVSRVLRHVFTINRDNKWVRVSSGPSRGSCVLIPPNATKVTIINSVPKAVYAFLNTFEDIAADTTPDFAEAYSERIMKDAGVYEYDITGDMHYLYFLALNSAGDSLVPTEIIFTLSSDFYTPELYPYDIDDFVSGGIDDANGNNISDSTRVRTNNYHRISNNYLLCLDARHMFRIAYYDLDMNYLGSSAVWSRSAVIRKTDLDRAEYFRLVFRQMNSDIALKIDSFKLSLKIMVTDDPAVYTKYSVLTPDVPKSAGLMNIILRAKQCSQITYQTQAIMPRKVSDLASGTNVKGLPYSSVRDESLYVPNCVSFDSFMTSILNPNSYLYTRQSSSPNSKTYMGAVCSSLVSYAYGLDPVYTTHQLGDLEAFELLEDQSIDSLALGDMLLRINAHAAVCTGILRDSHGNVKYIEVTEARTPLARSAYFGISSFHSTFLDKNFHIYRYKKADSVNYAPSQWVTLEGESAVDPNYNLNLFPRRGDKANWRRGEMVEIDVVDNGSLYNSYELYMEGTLIKTDAIPTDKLISLDNLDTGNYSIRLTNRSDSSDYAYFAVVDVDISVEDLGNKTAKITFRCSDNAVPSWFSWCYEKGSDINASKVSFVLTDTDIDNGYVISKFEAGTFKFKVEVLTDYGMYSSDFITADISE